MSRSPRTPNPTSRRCLLICILRAIISSRPFHDLSCTDQRPAALCSLAGDWVDRCGDEECRARTVTSTRRKTMATKTAGWMLPGTLPAALKHRASHGTSSPSGRTLSSARCARRLRSYGAPVNAKVIAQDDGVRCFTRLESPSCRSVQTTIPWRQVGAFTPAGATKS